MKTKLLILAFLFFCFTFVKAQMSFDQYFDGADTVQGNSLFIALDTASSNIWQIGKPQKIIFDSASTAPNAIVTDTINNYPINNVSRFSFTIIPWVTHGILGLQWKQKLDMDSGKDGGVVEFSVDGGNTWQNAFNNPHVYNYFGFQPANADTLASGQYALSGTDSLWRDIWLCYDMSWLSSNDSIMVRFSLVTDSINNNMEGWMIDNMNAHLTIIHPVKEIATKDYMNVYPNPSSNILHIELQRMEQYQLIEKIQLIDSKGAIAGEWKNVPIRFWIDTSKYPEGTYFLKVKSNIKSSTKTIVIKRK